MSQRGRKRKQWQPCEVVKLQGTLREAAGKWLEGKGHTHSPLSTSSFQGRRTYIAKCIECKSCTKEWIFSYASSDSQMEVQQLGDHVEEKNEQVMRRKHAKKFAQEATPGGALLLMEKQEIPEKHRPPAYLISNYRPKQKDLHMKVIADCTGSFQDFIAKPPEQIAICPGAVCTSEQVRIGFFAAPMKKWLEGNKHLSSFCMDFTFGIGQHGLALGGIGPLGLVEAPKHRPHVRMLPLLLMVAKSEDREAHQDLFKQYMQLMKEHEISVTDGFADCFCFESLQDLVEAEALKSGYIMFSMATVFVLSICTNVI